MRERVRCRIPGPGSLNRPLAHLFICFLMAPILLCGCGHFGAEVKARATFEEAIDLFNRGSYQGSLDRYRQIMEKNPSTADRVLFEMGIIHAHPDNGQKDYRRALECFRKIVRDHPASGYRQDSEMMMMYIEHMPLKDAQIASRQKQIEALQQEAVGRDDELVSLRNRIRELEGKIIALALQTGAVDRIRIEKGSRRLMLISRGEVLKTYKIALGGDPDGAKERQGDNKTPEGNYFIDARNTDSEYHLSLHISYPNEQDRKRAKELGVSPGGDIMIHGIRNGLSWIGGFHAEADWTKGCIAVTDEEIEEIGKAAPNGTIVEIRP